MKNIILALLITPVLLYGQSTNHVLEQARRKINADYGVSVYIQPRSLTKFGFNPDISTTRETVWQTGGYEYYPVGHNGNTIDSVSSSSVSDTQIISIEGHTRSGDDISFISFIDTLNGRTPVVLNTPLYRVTRLVNTTEDDFDGDVYIYSGGAVTNGVPQVADSIHLTVLVGANQSQKASTTISTTQFWIITQAKVSVGVSSGNNREVDFDLEVREKDKVFRRIYPFSGNNQSGTETVTFDPAIIIPPGADVRVTAISSGSGTQCKAVISGYLCLIN